MPIPLSFFAPGIRRTLLVEFGMTVPETTDLETLLLLYLNMEKRTTLRADSRVRQHSKKMQGAKNAGLAKQRTKEQNLIKEIVAELRAKGIKPTVKAQRAAINDRRAQMKPALPPISDRQFQRWREKK